MQNPKQWVAATAATIGLAVSAHAANTSYYAETGIEYDSNLTVDELNGASGEGDKAFLFGAGAEVAGRLLESLTLTAAYDLSSRQYESNDSFDQDVHLASVDVGYDVGGITLGASHHYSHARLDSDPFLDYHRSSIYLGRLVADNLYLSASLIGARKSFDDSNARDARIGGASIEGFLFFNSGRTLLATGIQRSDENADADIFDYQMLAAHARLKHPLALFGRNNVVQAGLRYEDRDYDEEPAASGSPLPILGTDMIVSDVRSDRIVKVDLGWTLELTEWLATEARVEHYAYQSPMESGDYDKTVSSVTLRANF